jgi:2-haloacid dehalogenase
MMVAAHEDDLAHARAQGLRTAFVRRPREFGHPSAYNLPHDTSFDAIADDFSHLAEQLGA